MKIQIVAIGDEVLNGQVVNTNAAWLADNFSARGYYVSKMQVVADDFDSIYRMIDEAFTHFDVTIVTGGLGPTKDDITKKVFADYFQCDYKNDAETEERVVQFFKARGTEMLEVNKLQSHVPQVATVLQNHHGTAPAMVFEKDKKLIFSLPGVPHEMKGIMEDFGFVHISNYFKAQEYYAQSVMTAGIGESYLADEISDWETRLRNDNLELAYLPSVGQVKLRITAKNKTESSIQKVANYVDELKKLIPTYYYGIEGQTLGQVVGELLKEKGLTLATMESCTGGGILNELIKTSGSSLYIKGGLVTYTNEMKVQIGGVSQATIDEYTELSEQCAKEMAEKAAEKFGTSVGVGITGLLENENGDTFAYISVCYNGQTKIKFKKFGKNRERNIQMSIFAALNFLRNQLLEK